LWSYLDEISPPHVCNITGAADYAAISSAGLLARTKPCSDGTTATSPADTLASNFIVQRSDQQSWCPAHICPISTKYDTKPGSNCLHCICVTTSGAPIGNFAGFGFSQQFTECSSSTVGALANQSII
jgi:hypothetical protein